MNYGSFYDENMLSAPSIRNCGFEEAPTATLPYRLFQVRPEHKAACMREAILTSLLNFQKLQNILIQANTAEKWKFYNVVICSIPDKISILSRRSLMQKIQLLNSMWVVAEFKTFFVPIEMDDLSIQQVLRLCDVGGPGWQYYPTNMSSFGEQFKQISKEMGVSQKPSQVSQEGSPYQIQSAGYSRAISLIIQSSQAMLGGGRWDHIINTICFYMKNLECKDLISGIVYDLKPTVIARDQFLGQQEERMHRTERIQQVNVPVMQAQYLQPAYGQQYARLAEPPRNANTCKICACVCILFTFFIIVPAIFFLAV